MQELRSSIEQREGITRDLRAAFDAAQSRGEQAAAALQAVAAELEIVKVRGTPR